MASTIVELLSPAGLTLSLELYPEGSDTIANGAGDTLTEATNRDGLYTATVTEALAGYYYAKIIDGSSNLIAAGWVKLADDTSTYTVGERVVAIEGTSRQLDDLNDPTAAAIADAVWDEATAGHVAGGSFGKMVIAIYDSQIAADGQINDVSATTTSFVTNLTEASDDHYNDAVITFTTGNLSGQSRVISDYDGTTKTVTVDEALTEAPANTDEFMIKTGHIHTQSSIADAVLTTQMTESYAADGTAPTLAQAQFAIQQFLQETNVTGTTLTVKKLDGSTTAMTFTLDDATSPTSLTRAT